MNRAIENIAKCIVNNKLNEEQIIKELEFLVRLATKNEVKESFIDSLDRDFKLTNKK